MQPIPNQLIVRFAQEFSSGRRGFSADEIPRFFSNYESAVPTSASYELSVSKPVLFGDCVRALSAVNQRFALYDLCDSPPNSYHPMPEETTRLGLLTLLVQADGRSPLGLKLSALHTPGIREQWMTAASRVTENPAAAISAARSMIETTCKTILVEHNQAPDLSGDLGRLYKQTRACLGINPKQGADQNLHQVLGGLSQVVDGIAGLSNKAGDRHGLAAGSKITNQTFAGLAVHAAGTAALFLVQTHKCVLRGP